MANTRFAGNGANARNIDTFVDYDSSSNSSLEELLLSKQDPSNRTKRAIPARGKAVTIDVPAAPYQPLKCAFCRTWGHHVDHCVDAFLDRINKTNTHCSVGKHSPYQHGTDWRCNYCGIHMTEQQASACPQYRYRKQR